MGARTTAQPRGRPGTTSFVYHVAAKHIKRGVPTVAAMNQAVEAYNARGPSQNLTPSAADRGSSARLKGFAAPWIKFVDHTGHEIGLAGRGMPATEEDAEDLSPEIPIDGASGALQRREGRPLL